MENVWLSESDQFVNKQRSPRYTRQFRISRQRIADVEDSVADSSTPSVQEFAERWPRHDVLPMTEGCSQYCHPLVGVSLSST
jgi:hypothetical protein